MNRTGSGCHHDSYALTDTHTSSSGVFCPLVGCSPEANGLSVSLRYIEQHILPLRGDAEPHPVVLDQGENLLVRDGVLIPDDEELLAVLNQLGDVFAEQRERRVGHHNIRLCQQLDALRAAKIAVAFEPMSPRSGTLPPVALPAYSSQIARSESWRVNMSRSWFL